MGWAQVALLVAEGPALSEDGIVRLGDVDRRLEVLYPIYSDSRAPGRIRLFDHAHAFTDAHANLSLALFPPPPLSLSLSLSLCLSLFLSLLVCRCATARGGHKSVLCVCERASVRDCVCMRACVIVCVRERA